MRNCYDCKHVFTEDARAKMDTERGVVLHRYEYEGASWNDVSPLLKELEEDYKYCVNCLLNGRDLDHSKMKHA